MHLWLIVSTVFNIIICFLAGFFFYRKKPKNTIYQKFSIFCFFLFLWAVCYFFPLFPESESLSFISFKLLHIGAIFVAVAHLDFVIHLLNIKRLKWLISFGYGINLIFLGFLIFSDEFIKGMIYKEMFGYWAIPGLAYHLWLFIWFIYILISLYLLLIGYQKSTGIKKKQIAYIFWGDIVSFTVGSTNFLLFYDVNILPYFNILSSGQMCLFSYVLLRYRYFELQTPALKFIKELLSVFFAILGFFLFNKFITYWGIDQSPTLYYILLGGSILAFYLPLSLFGIKTRHIAKILRLSDSSHFQKCIQDCIEKIHFHSSLKLLNNSLKETFEKKLKIEKSQLIFLEGNNHKTPELFAYFEKAKNPKPLVLEEMEFEENKKKKFASLISELKNLGSLCFPLYSQNKKTMGFWILGPKPDNPYYAQEIQLLEKVSFYININLKIILYHKHLEEEVNHKTKALKTSNEKLKKSYKELQQLDTTKDEFLSIASHELRTPLSVIKGYTEFLVSGEFGKLNARQIDFLKKIEKNNDELIDLINRMLAISSLESGKMDFFIEKVNLVPFIRKVQKNFKIIYQKKSITLSLSNPQSIDPSIYFDKEKLNIVFSNLLSNAYKFTPEGGKVEIKITEDNAKKKIRVSIKDNGVGIPKPKQKVIFNKFQQADNPLQKSYSGTGLGLNITQKIIKYFKGEIWMESNEDQGSNFIFTLNYNPKKTKK